MKYLSYILNRTVITVALILIQLFWIIWVILSFSSYTTVNICFQVLSLFIVFYIIGRDIEPSFKIAWIVLIFILPIFGGLFYLAFGNKRSGRRMRHKIEKSHLRFESCFDINAVDINKIDKHVTKGARTKMKYLRNICGFPPYRNTKVTYYSLGEEMFCAMKEELKKANHHIFVEYFIISQGSMWSELLDILTEKAAVGVDVRVMFDDMGSIGTLPKNFTKTLNSLGIQTVAFNRFVPVLSVVMNNRDHRKILVVDGAVAFCGGINISDEYINLKSPYGHWKDAGIKLCGEAAYSFTLMFLELWNVSRPADDDPLIYLPSNFCSDFQDDGFVQPFSDSPVDDECTAESIYLSIISGSNDYVYIYTPYLVIGNEIGGALRLAAKRGVDVRIITPGIPDKKIVFRFTRSNYLPLITSGVKIFEYSPGFIHAKNYVSDDSIGVVGTINMDFRSLNLHFECGVLLVNCSVLKELKKDFLQTQKLCREIKTEDCKTSVPGQMFDSIMRVFAPLM